MRSADPNPHVEVKPGPAPKRTKLDPADVWSQVMDTLGGKPTFRAAFEHAELVALNDERALIRLGEHEQLEFARMSVDTLVDTFKAVTGRRLRVAFEAPEAEKSPLDTQVITPELKKDAESNPLVRRAMELFDARIVRVEERRPGGQPAPGQSTEGTNG